MAGHLQRNAGSAVLLGRNVTAEASSKGVLRAVLILLFEVKKMQTHFPFYPETGKHSPSRKSRDTKTCRAPSPSHKPWWGVSLFKISRYSWCRFWRMFFSACTTWSGVRVTLVNSPGVTIVNVQTTAVLRTESPLEFNFPFVFLFLPCISNRITLVGWRQLRWRRRVSRRAMRLNHHIRKRRGSRKRQMWTNAFSRDLCRGPT